MAERKFELPGIQELTKEQEAVRALPLEGRHLIVGGPGTGKSIMALLRARRLEREGREYCFLVYNHLLNSANRQLYGGSLASETWPAWFFRTFRALTGNEVPRESQAETDRYLPIDWTKAQALLAETLTDCASSAGKAFLVIDEGQDMPPQFYELLIEMGFENIFVVADQNQQIHAGNSSRVEIEDRLVIDPDAVVELTENFRNSRGVAALAREFATADPASPRPKLPSRTQTGSSRLYSYSGEQLAEVARRIVRLADRRPSRLIGVIAPSNQIREAYLEALRSVSRTTTLENGPPPLATFHSECRSDVRFDRGGILVINVQACKGLEFDVAVCADIDEHVVSAGDLDLLRKRFYVMVARARDQVILLRRRGTESRVEAILPKDGPILRREEL